MCTLLISLLDSSWSDSFRSRISLQLLFYLCPGGDAGSCLETGCPEYGLFHPPGVAQRHGLTAVRQLSTFCCLQLMSSKYVFFPFLGHVFQDWPSFSVVKVQSESLRNFSDVVRCDSTEKLRNSLDYLRSVLNDSTSFKLIYRYAFDFARVSQEKSFL